MTDQPTTRIQIDVFDRYLAGECSASEHELVEAWISDDPERQQLLVQARQLDDLSSMPDTLRPERHSSVSAWKRFTEKQGAQIDRELLHGRGLSHSLEGRNLTHRQNESSNRQNLSNLVGMPKKTPSLQSSLPSGHSGTHRSLPKAWYQSISRSMMMGIAITTAVILVMLGPQLISLREDTSVAALNQKYTIYETRAGERTTVTLRDGSQIMLNVASRLEVPQDFGDKTRTVRLEGQAAFEVVESSGEPFIVEASGTRSTVLGTVFSVRAYTADVNVAVQSGKISFAPCNDGNTYHPCNVGAERVVLSANEVGRLNSRGELTVRQGAISDNEFSFMHGKLSLHGVTLRESINDLQRWYDVEIVLADPSLGDLVFDGAFPAGSVDNLVQALEVVLQVRAERKDRMITVYPREKGFPMNSPRR